MMLTQVGTTQAGLPVFAGLFRITETHGLPLDILLDSLKGRGVPCWMSYFREARAAGMADDRILARLEPAISDVFGAAYCGYVMKALATLIEKDLL